MTSIEQTQRGKSFLTDLERAAVRMAVGGLDAPEQRVVRDHFWKRLSLSEIARRLRQSVAQVKQLLAEALAQVRTTLEELFGFCFD